MDTLDDEIKLAGLESLVPEELEKYLILYSNRLRTFEDARLEIVTFVEARFGLRISDSKPSESGARGHSKPIDVDPIVSLASGTGNGKGSTRGCFKCVGHHVQRDCSVHVTPRKGNDKKGKQSKSWSKSAGKRKTKKATSQGQSEGSKSAKGSHKGKNSKTTDK